MQKTLDSGLQIISAECRHRTDSTSMKSPLSIYEPVSFINLRETLIYFVYYQTGHSSPVDGERTISEVSYLVMKNNILIKMELPFHSGLTLSF